MSMSHHDLKLMTPYFMAKARGVKPWEIRTTEDRVFEVGDTVTFHEVSWMDSKGGEAMPTGSTLGPFTILYLLQGASLIPAGACIFTHS